MIEYVKDTLETGETFSIMNFIEMGTYIKKECIKHNPKDVSQKYVIPAHKVPYVKFKDAFKNYLSNT